MRMMTKSSPSAGKAHAIALLSRMQLSLSEWLAMHHAPEQYAMSCPAWRALLHEVAGHARSAGLHAYSSLSVRIGEQLEPSFRSNDMPRSAIQLLLLWSRASLRYFRQSADFRSAAELVGLLRISHANYYDAEERAFLLRSLLEDRESDGQLGGRSEASSRSAGMY